MSNAALRLIGEKILTNTSACSVEGETGSEDVNMGQCLDKAGAYPIDARDPLKRKRFLPFVPEKHLFSNTNQNKWYWSMNFYNSTEGMDCCSNYTISSHYVSPKYMYTLYYLTYHLHLFGIQRRFPPLHRKINFESIVQAAKYNE